MSALPELLTQLTEVTTLLTSDPGNEEYLQLQSDLVELVEITREEEGEGGKEGGGGGDEDEGGGSDDAVDADEGDSEAAPTAPTTEPNHPSTSKPSSNTSSNKPAISGTSTFVIPDNLKLLSTDTEEVRLKKRKKVKGLKSKFNTIKSSALATEKQAGWASFKVKSGKKRGGVPKRSMYETGDVGQVVGSTSKGTSTEGGVKRKHEW